jgi:nucleoside-diphosphate-sugar epimerase
MVQHALDRGYEVVGVCREQSVGKLDAFKGRITIVPGATNDPEVIKRAVARCDGVLVVLVPRGVHGYSTGTAQAVLDHAPPGRVSCSRVAGTSAATGRTSIRGSSRRS